MKPLILSDPQSRAIKAGARQIRVPCDVPLTGPNGGKLTRLKESDIGPPYFDANYFGDNPRGGIKAPYNRGDLVPCKEAWSQDLGKRVLTYRADGVTVALTSENLSRGSGPYESRWQSPIAMTVSQVRHLLRITDRRPEEVSDISEADARASKVVHVLPLQSEEDPSAWWESDPGVNQERNARAVWLDLWTDRHPRHPWADSWCWVLNFELEGRNV